MNKLARILVVDDEERWRNALRETLERGDFYVEAVATRQEAITRLEHNFYHLIVLDIRLVDGDQANIEGMDILRHLDAQGLVNSTAVIMLSAYGTRSQMRDSFRDFGVADFIAKEDFDDLEFLTQVQRLFSETLHINMRLSIHWQDLSGAEEAIVNLDIQGERVKRNPALQHRVAAELEDLLCRLFYQADSVLLRPLALGHSGTAVLWAQPYYVTGSGRAIIVKFGDWKKIWTEAENFKTYVQPFLGGGRSTTLLDQRRTPLLGGILYSFLGATNDQVDPFSRFYERASIEEIYRALDNLFLDTCRVWYDNRERLQPLDLSTDYKDLLKFDLDALNHAFFELRKCVQGKDKLHFVDLPANRSFRNPIPVVAEQRLIRSTYRSITHGDFNASNILIDSMEHTWLIDFQSTGWGHILRDLAQLDCEIRFTLLAATEVTLEKRLLMEEALLKVTRFSEVQQLVAEAPAADPTLAKAYAAVAYLRSLAQQLVSPNLADDISEYYIALIYYSLDTLRFYQLPTVQRQHALLSASLLVEWLRL